MAADPFVAGRFLRPGKPILESTDGGFTFHPFSKTSLAGAATLAFDAHTPNLLVAGLSDYSVAVSRDGGYTFEPVSGSEKVPSGCSAKVLVDRERLFFLSTGSGVFTRTLPCARHAK